MQQEVPGFTGDQVSDFSLFFFQKKRADEKSQSQGQGRKLIIIYVSCFIDHKRSGQEIRLIVFAYFVVD
jgi:hypothetical protein